MRNLRGSGSREGYLVVGFEVGGELAGLDRVLLQIHHEDAQGLKLCLSQKGHCLLRYIHIFASFSYKNELHLPKKVVLDLESQFLLALRQDSSILWGIFMGVFIKPL